MRERTERQVVGGGGQEDEDRTKRFIALLTAHQRDLYLYINTLLLGDSATADVLQNTNLELWKQFKQFDDTRAFLPWAYRFAFYQVLAFRKSRRRSRLVLTDNLVELINNIYIRDDTPADSRLSALQICLQKLDAPQSQLIRERYVDKMTVRTIAARLGGTANQVSARLYRIRQSLSRCIRETLGTEMR
jgi:RNA polymerase sigma-70 factor, ECF subfamily